MKKKCPPGIICIENFTLIFLSCIIFVILGFMYIKYDKNVKLNTSSIPSLKINTTHNYKRDTPNITDYIHHHENNSNNTDILLNPYSAPLRDDRIFNNDQQYNGPKIPINVPTQSFNTSYRQIGILTRVNGPETILPLMGRPLFSNRDKWNFYTMNDKNNMIKLPITFKNKSCTSDRGCDNLYDGDTVHVEGYNDIFRVTVYDNNVMQYIPYL